MNAIKKIKKYYYGKKKRHTIKLQWIADLQISMVLNVEQAEGYVHDFQFYKDRIGHVVSFEIRIKTDRGCRGIAA